MKRICDSLFPFLLCHPKSFCARMIIFLAQSYYSPYAHATPLNIGILCRTRRNPMPNNLVGRAGGSNCCFYSSAYCGWACCARSLLFLCASLTILSFVSLRCNFIYTFLFANEWRDGAARRAYGSSRLYRRGENLDCGNICAALTSTLPPPRLHPHQLPPPRSAAVVGGRIQRWWAAGSRAAHRWEANHGSAGAGGGAPLL